MSSRRPVPQTSVGKLVSLTVDNTQYYTSSTIPVAAARMSSPPPPLLPLASSNTSTNQENNNADAEEKTMLWRNIATLFAQFDNLDGTVQEYHESLKRRSDDIYGELKGMWNEVEIIQKDTKTMLVRKLRKYVNSKCEKLKEDLSYGSSSADNEIFAYIDTIREDFNTKIENLQYENTQREQELRDLNDTYYRDYEMFVRRENELMAKLDDAVKMNEVLNTRLKHFEDSMMRQMSNMRDELRDEMIQRNLNLAGNMREELTHAITKELECESRTNTQLVQSVNDELVELVTRSNQYHSHRYFGVVEDIKQIRENSETLRKSIGMVDAELSDVKETVEHLTDEVGQNTTGVCDLQEDLADLKDDMYHELDRDYYDLKDYVKRRNSRHEKKFHPRERSIGDEHNTNAVQLIATEYAEQQPEPEEQPEPQQRPQEYEEHVIIIDENTFHSSDDEELAPQV